MQNRRKFLGAIAAGAPAILRARSSRERPNIVFAIADDQSWLHTGASGDPVVRTPALDRVAAKGVRFTHAFCCSPSCTPSRGGILTGQAIWRLKEGGDLWSTLPKEFPVYPDLLEQAGYHVGLTGKGWGPGDFKAGGRTRNPAGNAYDNFDEFFRGVPSGKPFCFWYGSRDPHRPYREGQGVAAGLKLKDVAVPPWLPDTPEVRSDILDYLFAIQRFDADVARILAGLEKAGQIENTLVVVTSDNGMPFPRAKTNLYDSGTRMPLAISWPARVPAGRVVDDFVSLADIAPTFLEAAGLPPAPQMTGRSLMRVLDSKRAGRVDSARDRVFTARERHTQMRQGNVGYPMRALRTYDYLYIRNFAPDRWPSGDPPHYGDIDNGPSKEFVIGNRNSPEFARFYELSCAKRPPEELYDLKKDPRQFTNVAAEASYAATRKKMREQLESHLKATGDPRVTGGEIIWDSQPYYGGRGPERKNVK